MRLPLSDAGKLNAALIGALALSLAAAVVLHLLPIGDGLTSVSTAKVVLSFNYWNDSWDPLNAALQNWRRDPTATIYAETFYKGTKFQYPPTAVFAAFLPQAFGLKDYNLPYELVSIAFLLLTLFAADRLIAKTFGAVRTERDFAGSAIVRMGAVAALALLFFPLTRGMELGQAQVWLNGLFALALLAWVSGQRVAPGVLIGLICLIKPQLCLFLIWGALRREWRFVFALGLTGAIGLGASVLVFGLDDLLEYVRVLGFMADRGEAFHTNQSVNGLLNRIMSLSDPVAYNNLNWIPDQFPPANPTVKLGVTISSAIILLLAIGHIRGPNDEGRAFDFCAMALSCTIASPIAWEHHYGLTFAIFALLFVRFWGRPGWMAALAVSFLLMGQLTTITYGLAATPFNFLQSHLLFGALLLLVLLHLGPPKPPAEALA